MMMGELGKKRTEQGEGQTIKEQKIKRAAKERGNWNKELQKKKCDNDLESPLDHSAQPLQINSEDNVYLDQRELSVAPVPPH